MANPVLQSRLAGWVDSYIAQGKLPFAEAVVLHRGRQVCAVSNRGVGPWTCSEAERPIYRLFSMTKPVVSLALMLLVEEARLQLAEPAWLYLGPKWRKENMRVMRGPSGETEPCRRSITVHQLLTHTAGLSHGLCIPGMDNPLDDLYAATGLASDKTLFGKGPSAFASLQDFIDKLAEAPLLFQPGEHWHYSYSVDLIGRIVEVVSGQSLEDFLQQRIFRKLGMHDTSFNLPEEKAHRFAPLYLPQPKGMIRKASSKLRLPSFCSGSGGLVGTCHDYMLFALMLSRGGVSQTGERIISKSTLEFMTSNHIRGKDQRQTTIRQVQFGNLAADQPHGLGFGLGFSVVHDTPFDSRICSKGEFAWFGAASTYFWVDPKEDVVVVFCTQLLLPDPRLNPLNDILRALVYGGLDHQITDSKL